MWPQNLFITVNVPMGNFCLRIACPNSFSKQISNLDKSEWMELGGNLIDSD